MFNRLAGIIVIFSFISLTMLFSGFIPPTISWSEASVPTPTIYTEADMAERFKIIETPEIKAPNKKVAKKPLAVITFNSIDAKQIKCLQENIYYESRNQSTLGQVVVGITTLARTAKPQWPNTICGVVFQRKQFSWTNHGNRKPNLKNVAERDAWERAGVIANLMTDIDIDTFANINLTHYHTTKVNPKWSKSSTLNKVLTIDDHVFYSDET